MLIIGLTGSIAMGKSTVAGFFKAAGVPATSADEIVHDLYEGRAADLIGAKFKGSLKQGKVDRARLMDILNTGTKDEITHNFRALEAIIHPLVREEEWNFLKNTKQQGAAMAVIDIPLLFETGSEVMMDVVVLASAPIEIQQKRALERHGMTIEKFNALNARQMDDQIKREKADFVIDTGCTLAETERAVKRLIERLETKPSSAYIRWHDQFGDNV